MTGSVWDRYKNAQAGSLTTVEQAALAQEVVDGLRAMPVDKRARLARVLGLPENAHAKLGGAAALLFHSVIDDDALRAGIGLRTISAWLTLDRAACMEKALAHAGAWTPQALWALVDNGIDPSEVFDILAPLYRANGNARALFTESGVSFTDALGGPHAVATEHARAVLSDERFVDLALETVTHDPVASYSLLGVHGSARAVDELRNLLEHASSSEEAARIFAAIELAIGRLALVDVLAAFLVARGPSVFAGLQLGPHPFAHLLSRMAFTLTQRDDIRTNQALRDAVARFIVPMPAG